MATLWRVPDIRSEIGSQHECRTYRCLLCEGFRRPLGFLSDRVVSMIQLYNQKDTQSRAEPAERRLR